MLEEPDAAARGSQPLMPKLPGLKPTASGIELARLGKFHPAAALVSDSFTKIDLSWVASPVLDMMRSMNWSQAWMNSLTPSILQIQQNVAIQAAQIANSIFDFTNWWSTSLDVLAHGVGDLLTSYYPPNWHGIDRPTRDDLDSLVLIEGIPLCWVPPGEVVEKLLAAPTSQARRDIIGRTSARILEACEESLDHVTSRVGLRYVRFARASLTAVRDGYREAGQSLAVNTLDTLVSRYGLRPPGENAKPDIGSMDIKTALVLGGLWSTYFSYRGDSPTAVAPTPLRRHATAHAVSPQQYNLRNATLAVMHLISLLRWLEINGYEHHGKTVWRRTGKGGR